MKKNGLVFATSDGGSENLPAMKELFGKENDDFVFVYCAAHAWSLSFTHAAGVLPGASKKKDKKNEKNDTLVRASEPLCVMACQPYTVA